MLVTGTILLSRQPLRPCGSDDWVKSSVRAVKWLKEQNIAFYSSIGVHTWELLTSLGSLYKLPLRIFIPCTNMSDFESMRAEALTQFNLLQTDVQFLPVFPETGEADKELLWRRRDKLVVDHSRTILPVSVRSGGHLQLLIDTAVREGKTIMDDFAVPYRRRQHRMAYRILAESLNPDLTQRTGEYLIHWTRSANSAWPGELLIDFYRDVISSDRYPRSAFQTLLNIVRTGTIVASSRHMPDNIRTVSFSSRAPSDMLPLFRWRARYREMSFEPYGLGIEREPAAQLGIKPVRYGPDETAPGYRDGDRWLSQSTGVKSDWRLEEEYRCRGDLNISSIPSDRLILFCRTPAESKQIGDLTGIKAESFTVEKRGELFEQ